MSAPPEGEAVTFHPFMDKWKQNCTQDGPYVEIGEDAPNDLYARARPLDMS